MLPWHLHPMAIDRATERWTLVDGSDEALSFEAIVRGWRENESFRAFWCASLRTLAFDAYSWECPPVTEQTLSRDFECVFVSSPALARMPQDPEAFAEHYRPDRSVVTFGNLGGDAVLVAPCPGGDGSNYSHLASFVATAPAAQQDALWQAVGRAMEKRIGASPAWASTAGLGVAWLHVRLDDRPKYYRHTPYARA
jgi:hypothetical protein